jgi:ABC-type branched-subunit amino acid transport system substrate-binding protein
MHDFMKLTTIILLLLFASSSTLIAQEELADYRQAKQLVSSGNFAQAMDLLSPFLDYDRYGEVSNYASYHFARAAYESRKYELAQNALKQLIRERKWKHQDDAKYLLALSYFQQQNVSEALKEIAGIQDEEVLKEAYRASYDFLQHISTSVLIVNLPNFQNNQGLVVALKNQLGSRSILSAGEQEVYDKIKNMDFSDEGETTGITRKINETLEVAVVLPFNYGGGSGVKRLEGNNFVFELYKGIKFAADKAREQGLTLLIRTYDTERKLEVVNKILQDPFFQLADVIVGPIYPEESNLVSSFAETHKIPFINPLSNIGDDRADLDYSYLFRPSIKSITEGILNYSKKLQGKRIAVAYSGTTRDELMARQFSESATKMGYQMVTIKQVSGRDMRAFFDNLSIRNAAKVDQIVIFSDDPNVASPTFAVMESITSGIPVMVMDSWLYFNFASYEMMDSQNFHFIGNNTVNVHKEEVEEFRNSFFETYNVYPDLNAHLGYELMQWLTAVLNSKRGFDFQKNLDQMGFQEGSLTFGFNFQNSRSNNYVPILKLQNGVLEVEQ